MRGDWDVGRAASMIRRLLCGCRLVPRAQVGTARADPAAQRVRMTLSCRDTDRLPKVLGAGGRLEVNGVPVQLMHDGTRVRAGGYFGDWMTDVIRGLRGHHEPQEEALFHSVLQHVRPGSTILELGAWWAYYSLWFLGAVKEAHAICVEPTDEHLRLTEENMRLNGRVATIIKGSVGDQHGFVVEPGSGCSIECFNAPALFQRIAGTHVEILHMDIQGAELPFLRSFAAMDTRQFVRFAFVSTHHESISGSPDTHADCIRQLQALGACILAEHDVHESFSGDGLIVASFDPTDAQILMPSISRNVRERSLFGWE
jgi:hypothetical protein